MTPIFFDDDPLAYRKSIRAVGEKEGLVLNYISFFKEDFVTSTESL